MGIGFGCASVIPWAQTEIEGVPAEPEQELVEGMSWSWHGHAVQLDGDGAALRLTPGRDNDDLRARAARAVRRMLQEPPLSPAAFAAEDADPEFRDAFLVSDGQRFYTLVPVWIDGGSVPLLLVPGSLPPKGRALHIVSCPATGPRQVPSEQPSVICFTPGTRLKTARGAIPIEFLKPGDLLLTRDNGPQEILWSGLRRMSGARLFALPEQRPVRIRSGALGVDRPDGDLVVSPEHRVLVAGAAPQDLWSEQEVLVRAADLIGDHRISVDHSLTETKYIHLMLERHEVVWANGLQVETFHPGLMELDLLDPEHLDALLSVRPDLALSSGGYGPTARRTISRAEAAILAHAGPLPVVTDIH